MYFPNRAFKKYQFSVFPRSNYASWIQAIVSFYYVTGWMFIWKENKHDNQPNDINILQKSPKIKPLRSEAPG